MIDTSRFKDVLSERDLKISTISKGTGISRTTLTELYYNRCKNISAKTMLRLCSYLSCDIGEIFSADTKEG